MTWLWALAVLTVVLVVACDRVPLTSPTGSTISVSIDRDTLPIGGTATVTAVVTEVSGTAVHNGTMVTFQPSLGRTDPVEAPTVNGKATVTYMAGTTSGTGVIHAFSGSARTGSGNSSAGGVTIKVGTAGADRVSVRTEPINVPVSGGTVVVVASLFDAGGNPIINTPLSFSSDFGALSSNSATTDGNGDARVQLTTNRTTVITVAAGAKSQSFTLSALNPPAVTLTCGTAGANTASVGVPVTCTITPPVVSGNSSTSAPITNVTINWGDGSGEIPLGALTTATLVAHTYTTAGLFQVTAAATDANSQRGIAQITLNVSRVLPTITITASATTASVGVAISFTVTPAATPPQPITNVTVNFGDGTTRDLGVISSATTLAKSYGSEGTFTVTATVTDQSNQRGNASTQVVITRSASPVITFTQTNTAAPPATPAVPEQFSVSATAATGLTIRSIVVTRSNGEVLFSGSGGGSFAASVTAGDVLTATATDSAGSTSTSQIVVQ
jgi:hypothetical protein